MIGVAEDASGDRTDEGIPVQGPCGGFHSSLTAAVFSLNLK